MNDTIMPILIVCLVILLVIQGTWVFLDARKRKIKYYWFWGFICLLNIPSNIIVYLIVRHYIEKKRGEI